MSRVINTSLATIQFQVNARQANAAMQALQNMSNDLNSSIDKVKKNIENLGKNVPKDNPQLLNYQNQLAGLQKDLKDVQKAQRDFLKGAKAADQLWKAASEGNIESLSFRSIKAGINGLKKRQEGLSPGDAQDMKDWRIIKQVIDEADRVVKQAGADVQNVVQTIREGGKVSEQTMRQTINTLRELKGSVDETDADFRTYGNDLDFMEAKLQEFSDAQRRARGEIVDANDARREMNKLTEEGAAAAKREAEEADRLVQQYKAEGEELVKKRNEIKTNIEDTQKQIDENHKLIEEKHSQLAADEETFNAEQQSRRTTIDGLKQQAEAERKLANDKSDAAETHRRAAELQAQTTQQLTEKVTELQGKLAALNAEPVKPKVDASEIDALNEKLRLAEELLQQKTTAANTAFNNYVSAQGPTPIDNVAFRENFEKMYGLAGYMDMSHMDAKRNLRFPNDMRIDYVEDAAGARDEDWEVSKEQAQKILDDYNWFVEKIDKVAEAIAAQYEKLHQASSEGVDPEQLKTVAANIKRLEDLRAQFLKASEDMAMDGVNRPQEMFGDVDKTIDNVGRNVDRAIKKAIDERYEFHEKKHAVEIQEAKEASELADKEKEAAQIAVDGIKAEIEAKKQNVGATKSETEAVKELEDAQKQLTGRKNWLSQQEGYLKEHLDVLKQIGLKEEDLADEGKVREAVEKKVLEIMQAQANVEKEVAEQQQKMIAGLKDNALGGTKADHEYYIKNRDKYELGDYATPDDAMERIAHLERLSKIKNGKRFDPYEDWEDEYDLDEDSPVMNDKEREAVKNELRILKQHVREEILKAIREAGDIDKGVENATGGDGVSEEAKFGEELNDKIGALKDKIHESIKTTVESYSDLLDEDIDREIPMTKEELTSRIKGIVSYTGESLASDRENIGWAKEDVQDAEALVAAKQKQVDAIKAGTQATAESNEKSEEELRLKGELETAQGKLAESKKRENDEQQEYVKLQGEAIEQGNKAAAAETKLADAQSDATQKQADFNQKQQEGLDTINQMAQGNQALQQSIDGLNGELEQNSKDFADNANKATAAEQQKQQAQQLTIKRMEEMLAKLKEEYYTEELTAEKREEHKQKIKELDEALRLAKGEWMSYGDAMKYANSIGSEGFMATDEQTKMATDALTRHREELVKTIQQKEADSQATSAERTELEKLDQALTKIKTGFASADDVLARWTEHMDAGKTASESMAQTLDEKLAGATSTFDEDIKQAAEDVDYWNKRIQEETQELAEMEAELEKLEKKHANSSWFRKHTGAYRREAWRIEMLRNEIGKPETLDDGTPYMSGKKGDMEWLKQDKQDAQERLAQLKKQKAEELGLTESEVQGEEKKADAKRLTNEQMQQGIKLLEEEYAKTDHTTEEGIKKRQQLREAIDQMNQELKESTGEWMSVADAMKLAGQAEKNTFLDNDGTGFAASAQDIQKATQALERQRDALLQTIKAKRDNKNLTKEEKAALDQEEAELQDLTNKLKALKFEQDNFNMSQAKMQELMRKPTNAVSLDELRSAIKRADGELKRMEGSLGQNNAQYKAFAEQVRNAKNQLKEMEGQAKASATAWEKAWSRLKTYVVMYMGFNAVWQKMVGTADDIMQLSDKMGEVRKTTGFTADEVGRLSDNLAKLDTRTSLTGLMEFSSLAGSIGMKTQEDVQGFTEAANMLAVSLPEMGNEASRTLMKIADATGDLEKNGGNVRETLERVGSTIIALRANSAAAAGPITDFVSRVGAVGAQAGISIDQIAALGATVDALGGRVEMSATALSRMIPAIKNNTFEVAKAIGMTEKELKGMTGMEQMVAIFRKLHDSAKGFDTSTEEGMNAMADSVEKALGRSVSMQEVMKELNQQGARAGIVFGLLSQNVDKLEEQLDTASEAYQKNTALMDEYSKMNDTTAAKWERLKNQLEEFIVGDGMQRFIGGIIDGLRKIVDLLTGDSGLSSFMRYSIVYFALLKAKWAEAFGTMLMSLGKFIWSMRESAIVAEADAAAKSADAAATTALGNATVATTEKTNLFSKAWGKLNAAMKANVIAAIATAVVWLGSTLLDSANAAKEAAEAINRVKEKTEEERDAVNSLFNPLKKANLEEAEKKRLITEINSKYGSYLSKMLTEASNAQEIARAYEAINLQLERKNTLEGINANKKKVMEDNKDVLDSAFNEMDNAVQKAFYGKEGTDASRISSFVSGAVSDAIAQGLSGDQLARQVETALRKEVGAGKMKEFVQIMSGGTSRREDASSYIANAAKRYYEAQMQVQGEVTKANKRLQSDLDRTIEKVREAADKDIPELVKSLSGALSKGTDAKEYSSKESGAVVEAFNAIKSYYDLHREDLSDEQKNKLLKAMGIDITTFQTKANAGGGGGGGSNPYGDYNKVTSPYSQWNGDDLVARRKEMLERVRALANGADVQKVLSEDAKFISEATRKNIKTTSDAIEWYNTERLKIQDALHEKHLTNTGDWMDPKQQKIRKKLMHDETRMFLDELDAYYTERKAKIQEAGIEEGITEAEMKNRTLANEAEWRQRRMELQKMYGDKAEEVTQKEQNAIFNIIAERTDDDVKVIKGLYQKTLDFVEKVSKMGEQGEKEAREFRAKMDKQAMQDLLKEQNAMHQQMKAIQDIIDKERPFNGITKNLRENLVTMGILTADMTEERNRLMAEGADMADFNARQAAEELKRTAFMLGEAENAYTTTIEDIMKRMADAGMTAWADELKTNPKMREALMAQLHQTYDDIQEAIKKEASLMKKQAETMWNNILLPGGDGKTTVKDAFEQTIAQLGIEQGRVSRANSLIGAGQASERVADKLAIKQMQLQLEMQQHYYNLMRKQGMQRIQDLQRQTEELEKQGKLEEAKRVRQDKEHVEMSLRLAMTKEQTDLLKQQENIIAKTEESQNRLYTALKEWGDLLASSVKDLMEASHAGDAEYYNELAKLNLTGKGGPGAGTYIVIDNAGTEDAEAHYEYLSEREALERQHEIERENAQAEAWRKVMDDLNAKMNEQITDWINASLQNQSIDANTNAVNLNNIALNTNTQAMAGLTGQLAQGINVKTEDNSFASDKQSNYPGDAQTVEFASSGDFATDKMSYYQGVSEAAQQTAQTEITAINSVQQAQKTANQQMQQSTQSTFAKMTVAANLYGVAYQTMSNDNLDASQKWEMFALQAAGQAAISMLTMDLAKGEAENTVRLPGILGKLLGEMPYPAAMATYAAVTALLGGLMGMAVSQVTKSKAQISQVTGASSASAGKLTTGMLQYGEGNVNEFTDPGTLTVGRQYNVDAADGRTYRARYMGKDAKTHLTNGPEFHLVGEKGQEAIIDAHTTRNIRMNDPEIWHSIQTLYNGGSLRHSTRRRGVRAFADGNMEDFEEMSAGGANGTNGSNVDNEIIAGLQASLDRNSAVLERALEEGFKGIFDVYGKGGLVDSYDTGKKTVMRHGERY